MQWSRLTRRGRILLTAMNLSILATLASGSYHTVWAESPAGQESSSTSTLSLGGAETEYCDASGCGKGITVFLTKETINALPFPLPSNEVQQCCVRCCPWGCSTCMPVIVPEASFKDFSHLLESTNKGAKKEPAR